jgi:hypothetical protein
MKKHLIFFIIILTQTAVGFSQQLIAVQKVDTTLFYTNIDSAMNHADNGDFIYLPGGTFTPAASNLIINKSVNIIGTGHYPDSTLATGQSIINGNIIVLNTGSGGSVQGVYVTGIVRFGTGSGDNTIDGFSFSRCNIAGDIALCHNTSANNPLTQNIFFSENVLQSVVNLSTAINVFFTKNIFNSYIVNTNGQVTFQNNIFLYGYNNCSTHLFHEIKGATFSNNIIIKTQDCAPVAGGTFTGNAFYNNIFNINITFPWSGNIGSGNIVGQHPDSIFISANPAPYTFDYLKNFHLKATSLGINAGTDGTDIGIYGTTYPYKEGAVPVNPHIQSQSIATETDSQGNLSVIIKVAAQSR